MERELERLSDEEEFLIPFMIELAELIEEPPPQVAERLKFGLKQGAMIRSASIENCRVDLVRLARYLIKSILQNTTGDKL